MLSFENFEGGGGFSFDDIAKIEAERLHEALSKIDQKLFSSEIANDMEVEEGVLDDGVDELYRRFGNIGYDAHSDGVSTVELKLWKQSFDYLKVEGTSLSDGALLNDVNSCLDGLNTIIAPDEKNVAQSRSPELVHVNVQNVNRSSIGTDLAVIGKAALISRGATVHADDDAASRNVTLSSSESFSSLHEGILEEVLAVNNVQTSCDDCKDEGNSEEGMHAVLSPESNRREEISSLLLDAIWPEVVDSLEPFLRNFVKYCRQNNVTYERNNIDDADCNDASADHHGFGSFDGYNS